MAKGHLLKICNGGGSGIRTHDQVIPGKRLAGARTRPLCDPSKEPQFRNISQKYLYLNIGHDSASALIKKNRVDLRKYPYLNWSWRIENRLDIKNEKIKSGDDYAARIYVIIDGGIMLWKTKAVNYVWANSSAKGEVWQNAYAGKNAMMMAIRSKPDEISTWYHEKRNVYEDLKKLLGSEFYFIDAIALMTDSDNSHMQVKSYYGDIYFSSE